MKSGGTFMIHLPWHQFPNARIQWPYRLADHLARGYDSVILGVRRILIGLGPAVMNTRIGRHFGEFMGNMCWDLVHLVKEVGKMGLQDLEVRCYYVPALAGEPPQPFFFGRKP